jgi:hypothetical protein
MSPRRYFAVIWLLIGFFAIPSQAALQFDPGNPQSITPDSSVSIALVGDSAPFAWHVSGWGAKLSYGYTTEPANTLNVNGSACGTIDLVAKNSAGERAHTSLRVVGGGSWVMVVDEMCGELLPLEPPIYGGCRKCSEATSGGYRFKDCWFGGTCLS